MTPRFPLSLTIAQITLSSVTIFLALSEVDHSRSIVKFILFPDCLFRIKNELFMPFFSFWSYFAFFMNGISYVFEQNRRLRSKVCSHGRDCYIDPN